MLALYAFLEYRQNLHSGTAKFPWAMPVLAFLAVGIHPYFLPLVMMCALLAAVELGRQKKCLGPRGAAVCGKFGSGCGGRRFVRGHRLRHRGHLAPAMAIIP